ncbi:MAG: hypothetical protein GY858_04920 [Candidatus Omnitrophica bacterium]|nr:hypothetical protein [Candidatus Omnitrophota bacterium]
MTKQIKIKYVYLVSGCIIGIVLSTIIIAFLPKQTVSSNKTKLSLASTSENVYSSKESNRQFKKEYATKPRTKNRRQSQKYSPLERKVARTSLLLLSIASVFIILRFYKNLGLLIIILASLVVISILFLGILSIVSVKTTYSMFYFVPL